MAGVATAADTADSASLQASGRLAQLGEHQLDKLGVTGSSPVAPTHEAPAIAGVSSSPRRTYRAAWQHFGDAQVEMPERTGVCRAYTDSPLRRSPYMQRVSSGSVATRSLTTGAAALVASCHRTTILRAIERIRDGRARVASRPLQVIGKTYAPPSSADAPLRAYTNSAVRN